MGQAQLIDIIKKAAPKHWQAAAWMAERIWPDEFGRQITGLNLNIVSTQIVPIIDKIIKVIETYAPDAKETIKQELAVIVRQHAPGKTEAGE